MILRTRDSLQQVGVPWVALGRLQVQGRDFCSDIFWRLGLLNLVKKGCLTTEYPLHLGRVEASATVSDWLHDSSKLKKQTKTMMDREERARDSKRQGLGRR